MISKPNGSAKKNLTYHNALIFHKSQNLTVKDQIDVTNLWKSRPVGGSEIFASYVCLGIRWLTQARSYDICNKIMG
jgi:hypothetical protein